MRKLYIFWLMLMTTAIDVSAELVSTNMVRDDGMVMVRFLSGSGSWKVPLWVAKVEVLVVGGGGAGARGGAWDSPGGGGGGFYYSTNWNVTAGSFINVEVGIGAPTTTSTGNGADGGNSIFGQIIAYGGKGGNQSSNTGGNQGGYSINAGTNVTSGYLGGTGSGCCGGAGAGEDGRDGAFSSAYGGAGAVDPIMGDIGVVDVNGAPITGFYGQMVGFCGGGSGSYDGHELGATHGEAYGGGSGSEPEGQAGLPGYDLTGGGGGGGRTANGGAGGDGIVIIVHNPAPKGSVIIIQ